jgi:hypothetical protein
MSRPSSRLIKPDRIDASTHISRKFFLKELIEYCWTMYHFLFGKCQTMEILRLQQSGDNDPIRRGKSGNTP